MPETSRADHAWPILCSVAGTESTARPRSPARRTDTAVPAVATEIGVSDGPLLPGKDGRHHERPAHPAIESGPGPLLWSCVYPALDLPALLSVPGWLRVNSKDEPVILSALANSLRRDRPDATDTEVRAALVEMIQRGLAEDDPAYVDLLHNMVAERLFED